MISSAVFALGHCGDESLYVRIQRPFPYLASATFLVILSDMSAWVQVRLNMVVVSGCPSIRKVPQIVQFENFQFEPLIHPVLSTSPLR